MHCLKTFIVIFIEWPNADSTPPPRKISRFAQIPELVPEIVATLVMLSMMRYMYMTPGNPRNRLH